MNEGPGKFSNLRLAQGKCMKFESCMPEGQVEIHSFLIVISFAIHVQSSFEMLLHVVSIEMEDKFCFIF